MVNWVLRRVNPFFFSKQLASICKIVFLGRKSGLAEARRGYRRENGDGVSALIHTSTF